ncbi:hypothetical protein A3860_15125 [Niastella vici]|uniref:DUF4440 domain-containing protein n=2 Tax=Niastella vici TaxID=1703345 RepID=A0A1V9G5K4_9BACT|nr:hypothetical protein A3860_15125 [Niastella vici]
MACCWLLAAAQRDEVAQAERAFAQMAADSGTKKAFLHFLADSSFIFYKGDSYAAMPYWKSVPERTTLLLWKPVYTGVASSGEIGFSTGPFEQRLQPAGPIGESGNYNSIWAKNKQGQWKVVIDISVSYKPSLFQQQWEQPVNGKLIPVTGKCDWQKTELDFIDQHKQKGNRAFLQYVTNNTWFNVQDRQPWHSVKEIEAGLAQIPAGLQFSIMGGGIAASGDLFYVYGLVTHNGNKENYLRVWGYQPDGWKLLLQVLKWPR